MMQLLFTGRVSSGARATPRKASPARAERSVTNGRKWPLVESVGGADDVGDFHEFVGVGAIVSILADGGGDGVDGGGAVAVDDADDVTAAACRGFDGRWIVRDAVRHAKVQPVLDDVLEHPSPALQDPLLQAGGEHGVGGQVAGIRHVYLSVDGLVRRVDQIALVANVQGGGVGEPDPEGIVPTSARSGSQWLTCQEWERLRESREGRDRNSLIVRRARSIGGSWQGAARAHLVDGVVAVAAAALGDVDACR